MQNSKYSNSFFVKLFVSLSAFFLLLFFNGCSSMKPIDFADKSPKFTLEEYFQGDTRAWGVVHDRFGDLRRQFTVDIHGEFSGDTLVLTEDFLYSDGETEQRIWTIKKIDEHNYEGTAKDVDGIAKGVSYGNALNWSYLFNLKLDDSRMLVRFDDWMFLQPDGVLVNRAVITKWGFEIAEVSIFFKKE